MTFKLNTPKEEVDAIYQSRKVLTGKTQKLQELRNSKKEAFEKQIEDCSKSKSLREAQKKLLKDQVNKEDDNCRTTVYENTDTGIQSKEGLLNRHLESTTKLNKEIDKLQGELKQVMKNNDNQEQKLRGDYKK